MSPHLKLKMEPGGPKKILALDGGGIRGIIEIEVLAEIENMLQIELKRDDSFVLANYFDFVAGTSTGAIIAACVSMGMRVSKIREFYISSGEEMFDKAALLRRFHHKFEDEKLVRKLKSVLGADTVLGSEKLKTLLMMVMRNASTDSPWPISNNPNAKYNDPNREDCNCKLPLWQLIRASTAAPTYFPPEAIRLGRHEFLFVDGGVTPYNNPSFQAFLMTTMEAYNLQWEVGENNILLVSIGTGCNPEANANLAPGDMNLLFNAGTIPSALMYAALNEQDLLCRVFGKCLVGDKLDNEVGTLIGQRGPVNPKLFTYNRYNGELTQKGLADLGITNINPKDVQRLDAVEFISQLQVVGKAIAKKVNVDHFRGFF